MADTVIANEEELYRSIRGRKEDGEYHYNDDGMLVINPDAFRDRNKEPSVDRAALRDHNPVLSRKPPTDGIEQGVVTLLTLNVRDIGDVVTPVDGGKNVTHSVDVIYDPLPDNIAHAKVTVEPEFFGAENKKKKAFKLLRISLAYLATDAGWTLEPR